MPYIENISLVTLTWNSIDLIPALAPGVGITFSQEPKWSFQPLGAVSKHVQIYNPDQSGMITLNTLSEVASVKTQLIAGFIGEVVAPLVAYNGVSGERWTFANAVIPQLPDQAYASGEAVQVPWTLRYESLIYLPGSL